MIVWTVSVVFPQPEQKSSSGVVTLVIKFKTQLMSSQIVLLRTTLTQMIFILHQLMT